MNTRSMTKKINNNANNVINNNIKDKFMSEVQALVNENINNQIPNYESLKTRIRAVIKIAKRINKEIADVLPYWSNASRDKILSVMFITLNNLSKQAEGSHIKDYIDSERRSLKIRKMSLSVQSHCGKALSKLWKLIHNYDVSNVPNYDTIVELHRQKQNKYNLRPRTAIVYTEEDQVDDISSDADYNDELEQKMARMDRIVNYVVNKNVAEKDYEYDSSSDYDPNEDLDDNDDESLHFDDDDYAEESEEDDYDYEDEDEYRQADLEFLDEYFNDPDYIQTSSEKVKKVQYDDDDEEYLPEDEDDDDDYLLDSVSESDYDDDSSSDYDPTDDVKSNFLDDHILHFDDDDYAEEDDDDYEDDSADEEDAQFVSDYFNDPDYDPAEDDEEEDELEYNFTFKNKKEKENVELVLEAGIANDDGDDSEDYNPDEDEDDEEDEDEVVKVCMNNKLIKVCKRLYNRTTGKVNYKWVNMTEDEYNKKYDADYQEEL